MKIKKILPNVILAAIVLVSCSKAETQETAPVEKPHAMSAKINGADWSDNFVVGFISIKDSSISIEGGRVGAIGPNYTISLLIDDFPNITPGTYNLTSDGSAYVLLNKQPYTHYISVNGTVTFTKIDKIKKTISGTFSFKTNSVTSQNDVMNITDGVFTDLLYQYNHVSGPQ